MVYTSLHCFHTFAFYWFEKQENQYVPSWSELVITNKELGLRFHNLCWGLGHNHIGQRL